MVKDLKLSDIETIYFANQTEKETDLLPEERVTGEDQRQISDLGQYY